MKKTIFFLLLCVPVVFVSGQKKLGMVEFLQNTTVKIETVDSIANDGGKEIFYGGEGTGFFFQFETEEGKVPAIVTTKHVIDRAITISFLFTESDSDGLPIYGKQQKYTIKRSELPVIYHPDANVDLAVIPINPVLDYFQKRKIMISYHPLDETVIPSDSVVQTINTLEDMSMIGHPANLSAELKGRPIITKGVCATPMFLDYNDRKEFLVAAPVYDGCSGAPILLYQWNYSNRFDAFRTVGQRVLLVGISYAVFTTGLGQKIIPRSTHIISGSGEKKIVSTTDYYENISVAIKSQTLFDFKKILSGLKK